ncbi:MULTISPECIES: radical SAM protein [Cyanophyceae]|uniref:radical SAM protein n=1 Tax=Cyanophyceae TaxID=3028117 RepID=UPI00016DC78F|nr:MULTISPECIES: radical SAM protein [Cyanophyceae]ACA99140.1 radical SAM domain protein [Picosynechococcus sp. PCC 7002]SMH34443.1 Radical SAM superfamily enzyme, MoaA/NifB/PqqE/SkfB family [Picosynechococcus sp. OG1]SMQ84607.1 Radical SAM superfamily enzyme, MoaA/NifB/PqqE/SkfB family [Synechococcus sp. 7002]
MSNSSLSFSEVSKVDKLVLFIQNQLKGFQEVKSGKRDDWGEDSIKIVFHRKNFSEFLLGNVNKIIPITFEMWPSLSCDARCPKCTYRINKARYEDDKNASLTTFANTSDYLRLISMLSDGGVRSVTLTGGGEPLLNPDFGKIIKHVKKCGMSWGMFTHGLHLKGEVVNEILDNPPRFIRVSLNSSSPITHHAEYRIGEDAYFQVINNVVKFATKSKEIPSSVGVGYAIDPVISDSELLEIGQALDVLYSRTNGGLKYASFRPKVVYYNNDTTPKYNQFRYEQFALLPQRVKDIVVPFLTKGNGIRIDLKHHLFHNISERKIFNRALGLSWASQVDHRGVGYLLNELNGSPWSLASYGNFLSKKSFESTWYSESRLMLTEQYQNGDLSLPLNIKTSHVEHLLNQILDQFGLFSTAEVEEFWKKINLDSYYKPSNWDFL